MTRQRGRAATRDTSSGAGEGLHGRVGRDLVVLGDGPWARHWYWRDDLEAIQAASRAVGYPDDHPSAQLRNYRNSDQQRPHPDDPDRVAQVWTYRPPDAVTRQSSHPAIEQAAQPAQDREVAVGARRASSRVDRRRADQDWPEYRPDSNELDQHGAGRADLADAAGSS